jgi:hypothetical protein
MYLLSRDESVVDGKAGHELLEDNGCFVIESNLNSVLQAKIRMTLKRTSQSECSKPKIAGGRYSSYWRRHRPGEVSLEPSRFEVAARKLSIRDEPLKLQHNTESAIAMAM